VLTNRIGGKLSPGGQGKMGIEGGGPESKGGGEERLDFI